MYLGTVILQMSEEEFWRATPRKLFSLARVHLKANGEEESPATERLSVKEILSWR